MKMDGIDQKRVDLGERVGLQNWKRVQSMEERLIPTSTIEIFTLTQYSSGDQDIPSLA